MLEKWENSPTIMQVGRFRGNTKHVVTQAVHSRAQAVLHNMEWGNLQCSPQPEGIGSRARIVVICSISQNWHLDIHFFRKLQQCHIITFCKNSLPFGMDMCPSCSNLLMQPRWVPICFQVFERKLTRRYYYLQLSAMFTCKTWPNTTLNTM